MSDGSKLHVPPIKYLLAAQQELYKNIFWKKVGRKGHWQFFLLNRKNKRMGHRLKREDRKGESNVSPDVPDKR